MAACLVERMADWMAAWMVVSWVGTKAVSWVASLVALKVEMKAGCSAVL